LGDGLVNTALAFGAVLNIALQLFEIVGRRPLIVVPFESPIIRLCLRSGSAAFSI